MEQEIVDYISKAQKHGLSDFEIKQNLVNAGWDAETVEQSFVFSKAAENNPGAPKVAPGFIGGKNFEHTVITQTNTSNYLSGNNQNKKANAPFYKRPALWGTLVFLILLAAGAYAYYNYVYLTPVRIWNNYLISTKPKQEQIAYSIIYSGGAQATGSPITLTLAGNTALDKSDPANFKTLGDNTFSLQNGGVGYNMEFKDVYLGQVLYAELGKVSAFETLIGNQTLDWIKFDPLEIQNYSKQNSSSSLAQLLGSSTNNPELKSQLMSIWSNAGLVKPTNFLARESLNGIAVYHLKGQIDQTALDAAVLSSIQEIQAAQGPSSTPITGAGKAQITALLNRFQQKGFDVWIGRKDYQLYKINLAVSAPSSEDFSSGAAASSFLPSAEQSRDAKRLSDVRQLQSALELYHNDFGGYPAVATGTPQELVPYYIPQAAVAPEPADGNCTDYFNGYWYKVSGKARTVKGQIVYPSYTLTFCLGSNLGGYKAGIGELSPTGILSNVNCPATVAQCVSSSGQQSQNFIDTVNKMDFEGQIGLTLSYSALGKAQNIIAPPTSTDFLDLLNGSSLNATSTAQVLQ